VSVRTARIALAASPPDGTAFAVPSDAELAVLTLDRPAELNPLDHDTIRALRAALDELDRDPRVRAIAVTGAGRAFSAGGDMKKYRTLQRDPVGFPAFLGDLHGLLTAMGAAATPVIALVNGIAVAGGIELLLGCDFAVAAESARIGDAHLPYGQMGGGGSLTLLPRTVGPARARELVFTGRLRPAPRGRRDRPRAGHQVAARRGERQAHPERGVLGRHGDRRGAAPRTGDGRPLRPDQRRRPRGAGRVRREASTAVHRDVSGQPGVSRPPSTRSLKSRPISSALLRPPGVNHR
jgi:hypothetical protein